MLQLVVIAGPDKGSLFTVQSGDNLMLGRSTRSFYRVSDPSASRSHCMLEFAGDQVKLVDNNSASGTFVNNKRVSTAALTLGDVIRIGDTELRIQLADFPMADTLDARKDTVPPENDGKVDKVERLEHLSGTRLAHYDIGPVIGTGTTSMIFHATDTRGDRSIALKVLLPEFAQNEEEIERFIRAMKTMLPQQHPNLIKLHGAGKTGRYCWVAMEFIAGENMAQVIERLGVANMLDWRYAFKVAMHVGRALAFAHSKQIIHRNVTPRNILLETPTKTVKLGDLMLAKALDGTLAKQITRRGELLGEVEYMSPERTRGLTDIDGRSDIYGLGATVYALLTGRPPFGGTTLVEKLLRIRQDEPAKPTKYQLSIPSAFEGVVLKMLAKDSKERYQDAEALLDDLGNVSKYHGGAS